MVVVLSILLYFFLPNCYYCNFFLQSVTNFFIANLALADVIIGLFAIPFQVCHDDHDHDFDDHDDHDDENEEEDVIIGLLAIPFQGWHSPKSHQSFLLPAACS